MLFDLQGKRRRVVQVVYASLALLMGGGLVLFGIGGEVSGGLFDAFGERNGGGGTSGLVEDRIEAADKRLVTNPRDENALKELVRSNYQLANEDANEQTGEFGEKGKGFLRRSASAWERYVALPPTKPDDNLARLVVNVYSEAGLKDAPKAARAAELLAEADPTPAAYLQLVNYATQAGQTRKATLAGRRAVELGKSSAERKAIKAQVEQFKAAAAQASAQQAAGSTPGAQSP